MGHVVVKYKVTIDQPDEGLQITRRLLPTLATWMKYRLLKSNLLLSE